MTPGTLGGGCTPGNGASEHFVADLAEMFSVSRATVYRVLDRAAAAPAP